MQRFERREVRGYIGSNVPRLRWCHQLHHSFVKAVYDLGGRDKATPKTILERMDVKGLTIPQIKSHLQTYRSKHEKNETQRHGECKSKCFLQQQILRSQELYSRDKVNTTQLSVKRLWQDGFFAKVDGTHSTNLQEISSELSDISKSYGSHIQGENSTDSSVLSQCDIHLPKFYRENHTKFFINEILHKKRKLSFFSDHNGREEFHTTGICSSSCTSRKILKAHEMRQLVDLFLSSQQCGASSKQKRLHLRGPSEVELIQRLGHEIGKSEVEKDNEWQCEMMDINTKKITTIPVDFNCLSPFPTNFRPECPMKLDLTMSI